MGKMGTANFNQKRCEFLFWWWVGINNFLGNLKRKEKQKSLAVFVVVSYYSGYSGYNHACQSQTTTSIRVRLSTRIVIKRFLRCLSARLNPDCRQDVVSATCACFLADVG